MNAPLRPWNVTHTAPLVGAQHHPLAREAIAMLPDMQEVLVKREPENKHDTNAVIVLVSLTAFGPKQVAQLKAHTDAPKVMPEPLPIGYLARAAAAEVAPVMDRLAGERRVTRALLDSQGKVHLDLGGDRR